MCRQEEEEGGKKSCRGAKPRILRSPNAIMRARPAKRRKTATSTGSPTEDALIPVTPTSINAEKQPCAHSEDTPTSVERMTAKLLWGAEELRRAGDRTRAYMCLKTCLSFVQPTAVEIDVRLRLAELLAPAKAAALLDEAKACATKAYQMACELADIDDRLKYRCVHWMAQLVAGAAVDKAVQKERARALRLQRHELFIKLGICSARLRARNPASLARAFEDLAASIGHADAHGCIEGKVGWACFFLGTGVVHADRNPAGKQTCFPILSADFQGREGAAGDASRSAWKASAVGI